MNLARFLIALQRSGIGTGINQLAVLLALYQAEKPLTSLDLCAATGIEHSRDVTRIGHQLAATHFVSVSTIEARENNTPRLLFALTPHARETFRAARHLATKTPVPA